MIRLASIVLLLVLTAAQAHATGQGVQVTKKWKTMDLCTKLAQTAYPDFTAEANAKREAAVKSCLEGNNLPPREPVAPGR